MIIFLILFLILYFFFTNSSPPQCSGTFSGGAGVWSSFVFSCLNGSCTYTQGGVAGSSTVFAYSIDVGNLVITATASGIYYNVLINCTAQTLCARLPGGGQYSLAPNEVGPEQISVGLDNGRREFVITEGPC